MYHSNSVVNIHCVQKCLCYVRIVRFCFCWLLFTVLRWFSSRVVGCHKYSEEVTVSSPGSVLLYNNLDKLFTLCAAVTKLYSLVPVGRYRHVMEEVWSTVHNTADKGHEHGKLFRTQLCNVAQISICTRTIFPLTQ